jgi:hypothetical protein
MFFYSVGVLLTPHPLNRKSYQKRKKREKKKMRFRGIVKGGKVSNVKGKVWEIVTERNC